MLLPWSREPQSSLRRSRNEPLQAHQSRARTRKPKPSQDHLGPWRSTRGGQAPYRRTQNQQPDRIRGTAQQAVCMLLQTRVREMRTGARARSRSQTITRKGGVMSREVLNELALFAGAGGGILGGAFTMASGKKGQFFSLPA